MGIEESKVNLVPSEGDTPLSPIPASAPWRLLHQCSYEQWTRGHAGKNPSFDYERWKKLLRSFTVVTFYRLGFYLGKKAVLLALSLFCSQSSVTQLLFKMMSPWDSSSNRIPSAEMNLFIFCPLSAWDEFWLVSFNLRALFLDFPYYNSVRT